MRTDYREIMREIAKQFLKIFDKLSLPQKIGSTFILVSLPFLLMYFFYEDAPHLPPPSPEIISQEIEPKGYELFDQNTWIKGERELQVLEMRALRGQLEKDLAGFESIKKASVVLDIAQNKAFGSPNKTKASVILTLMPEVKISSSLLDAITYHLTGAVRGLEPQMVAISDTKGRLYQALDTGQHEIATRIENENMKASLEEVLETLFGKEHYSLVMDREQDVSLLLDNEVTSSLNQNEIERHLRTILNSRPLHIDFISFKKEKSELEQTLKKEPPLIVFGVILSLIFCVIFFWTRRKKRADEKLFNTLKKMDLPSLTQKIKRESPATIALLLSYLEPARAEKVISTLPDELQESVLTHLSAMEP